MKVICAGGRNIPKEPVLEAIKESGFEITEIVCGEASGADSWGKVHAKENNIPVKSFPANWGDLSQPDAIIKTNKFGKKYDAYEGMRRNKQMAEYADALILTWDGKSKGSANMLQLAKQKGLKIYQKIV